MAKTGFNYFCIDTDIYQDRKIKRLKKRCGCVGMCVYQYILCEAFRVRGYMLEWDEDTIFDIAECFGIEEAKVSEVVEYMTEVGLFDSEKLAQGVLTSASIQRRYYEMSDKAKRKGATIPDAYALFSARVADKGAYEENAEIPEEFAEIPENSEKFGNNSEEIAEVPEVEQQSKVKESKVKKSNISLSDAQERAPESMSDLTAAEREGIFEILFFERNVKNLNTEADALIGYYTANGWRRSGGITLKNRVEVARTWKTADAAPRVPPQLLEWLKLVHAKAKEIAPPDAYAILHGFISAEMSFKNGRTLYVVTMTAAGREATIRHIDRVPRPNFSITIRANG